MRAATRSNKIVLVTDFIPQQREEEKERIQQRVVIEFMTYSTALVISHGSNHKEREKEEFSQAYIITRL